VGAYGQDWAPAQPQTPAPPQQPAQQLPQTPKDWADYGRMNPDVAAEWSKLGAGNFSGPEDYFQWHFQNHGQKEGRLAPIQAPQTNTPYAMLPTPMLQLDDLKFASGGYVRGPGDGTSDSVPAIINGRQPAKLSDGEYVLPAMAVAKIGNGSNEAGAKKLDKFVKGLARA
jgi:hypothetical protein